MVRLGNRGSGRRCLAVWGSGTSLLGGAGRLLAGSGRRAWADRRSLDSLPLDRALSGFAVVVLLACLVWAWAVLTLAVLEAWRGRTSRRQAPSAPRQTHGVRRVVLACCGVAVVSAGASPAVAVAAPSGEHDVPARLAGPGVLTGLPLPERAVAGRSAHRQSNGGAVVVVGPGDSLWSIARRELPAGASDADVTDRWQAIYARNRGAIGPDPGLIRPGLRLHLPRKDPS